MNFNLKHGIRLLPSLTMICLAGCGDPQIKEAASPPADDSQFNQRNQDTSSEQDEKSSLPAKADLRSDSASPETPIAAPKYTVSKRNEDGSVDVVFEVTRIMTEIRIRTVRRADGTQEDEEYPTQVALQEQQEVTIPPGQDISEYLSKIRNTTPTEP